jgi:hypothetical protein
MIAVNAIGNCQRESFWLVENTPEDYFPEIDTLPLHPI